MRTLAPLNDERQIEPAQAVLGFGFGSAWCELAPMAAITAVEISGPMPGTLVRRRQLASFSPIVSISPAIVSIRSSTVSYTHLTLPTILRV